jgi:hypothetical protein
MYEVPSVCMRYQVCMMHGVYMLVVNTLAHRREGRVTRMEMLVRRGARHAGGNGTLEEMEMLVRRECGTLEEMEMLACPRGAARWRRWRC